MSWKSLVSAGLLCVLASPVLAAPELKVTGGRRTTTTTGANNVRVWNVAVSPDLALDATGSPLALELGFRATGGNILSISTAQNSGPAPEIIRVEHSDNPGAQVFGWEALTDVGGGNMQAVGLQQGTGANADEAVAYIGTNIFTVDTNNRHYDVISVRTEVGVTSLAWGGRYNADHTMAAVGAFVNGRIAHSTGATTADNFDTFAGSLAANATTAASRFLGDMNGDGNTDFGDLAGFGQAVSNAAAYRTAFPHLNRVGRGDVSGDGNLDFGDLAGFGQVLLGTAPTGSGSGLGGGSAVPEPTSCVLAGLVLAFAAMIRRRS
jgi:hypothetical protein